MITISGVLPRSIYLICAFASLVVVSVFLFGLSTLPSLQYKNFSTWNTKTTTKMPKDIVNNTGASAYLKNYKTLFDHDSASIQVEPDPNVAETITTWWQAAAMIDWYINSPMRHNCMEIVPMGNWYICQDQPYTIQPPCLVYSFGMSVSDHQRDNGSMFHNIGIGYINTDTFLPRKDRYVPEGQLWNMRTIKTIMKELHHESRVIDVFKMDIESYEWAVLENMLEADVLKYIRQLLLEYHLFPSVPSKKDYLHIYKIATRIREMGFREFFVNPHPRRLTLDKMNNQGDVGYINVFFKRESDWK